MRLDVFLGTPFLTYQIQSSRLGFVLQNNISFKRQGNSSDRLSLVFFYVHGSQLVCHTYDIFLSNCDFWSLLDSTDASAK